MARTNNSPSYITTTIAKLLALGVDENEPLNIRRLDVEEFAAKNLEKLLTVAPKADTVDEQEQVQEFRFDN